jgi:hypothetical protein
LLADVLAVSNKFFIVRQIRLDIVHDMGNAEMLAVALVRTLYFTQRKPFGHRHSSWCIFFSIGLYNYWAVIARVAGIPGSPAPEVPQQVLPKRLK